MSTGDLPQQERGPQFFETDIYRAAMDACPQGIALREGDVLLYTNPAWDLLTGVEPGGDSESGNANAISGGTAQREVAISTHTFEHCGATVSLAVARDVSEQKKTERQLHEAQKLEALGRWVGGVVHDFNNLLTAVMLYSDMVAQSADASSAIRRYNGEIRDVVKRGAGLTGQLLAFVQQRPFQRSVISVNSLLKGLRDVLERMIGEDVPVLFELSPQACHVKMDPAQLQQVVFNLALNGRDAMADGGKLTIRTSEASAEIDQGSRKCVRLDVIDEGCGMDAAVRQHIFEPFFTTKPEGKGTGLGLTIVQQIVNEAGGVVRIESEPGAGTVVSVIIPCTEPPTKRELISAEQGQLVTGWETLLVVEDDAAVRSSLVEALAGCGYQVLQAANGHDALRMAKDFVDDIHLLITDLVLPGMSGRELARRLRSVRANTRVLFVSGYGVESCCSQDIIFEKPFNTEALAERVRQALAETPVTSDPGGR
jgi:two-component system, cell cycle sensor histidine kinase and response regulator CckA